MKTIWKYTLRPAMRQVIEIWATQPPKPLTVQVQPGVGVVLWAEVEGGMSDSQMLLQADKAVDPNLAIHRLTVTLVGTGDPLLPSAGQYLATIQDGPMVWHVYWR